MVLVNEATSVLFKYLAAMPDAAEAAQVFAPAAVLEFAYFGSLDLPGRFEGREAIAKLLQKVTSDFEDFRFHNIQFFPAQESFRAFGEYEVDVLVRATQRRYRQLYGAQVVVENGMTKRLREFTDTVAIAQAVFPGGILDLAPQT